MCAHPGWRGRRGRIEQAGAPDEIRSAPASPFVLNFIADVNHLPTSCMARGAARPCRRAAALMPAVALTEAERAATRACPAAASLCGPPFATHCVDGRSQSYSTASSFTVLWAHARPAAPHTRPDARARRCAVCAAHGLPGGPADGHVPADGGRGGRRAAGRAAGAVHAGDRRRPHRPLLHGEVLAALRRRPGAQV